MRSRNHIRAAAFVVLSTLMFPVCVLHAQQSTSASGDKTPPSQSSSSQADQKAPADDNAFPEDTSRAAAKQAEQQKAGQQRKNSGQPDQASREPQQPATDDNAFPEEASRKAADAAKSTSSGSGVSSSSDYEDRANAGHNPVEPNVSMRHIRTKDLAREDLAVGSFYLQSGDFKGAYARYKEASLLHPENTDAMFGLAEAARHLNKNDEALQNYRLYLDVIPSGSKAKDARKALALLSKSHQ